MKMVVLLVGAATTLAACGQVQQQQNETARNGAAIFVPSEAAPTPTSRAYDGPFGLRMGEPISDLDLSGGNSNDPADAVLLASVPKPTSEFESYAVVAYPEVGVCEIRAVSKTFESDAYGVNVRAAMDALAKALDSKYGKHSLDDHCSDYSCKFFQMNLKQGSQNYYYEWSTGTGATLPPDIATVAMGAMPGEFNNTFFRLDYTSADTKRCEAAKNKAKSASL